MKVSKTNQNEKSTFPFCKLKPGNCSIQPVLKPLSDLIKNSFLTSSAVILFLITSFVYIVNAQTGVYTLNGGTASQTGQTYSATNADQSAVYVLNSGNLTLTNCTMNKTGDASNVNNSSQYGTNAGVLSASSGVITITGGTVTTNASGANGLFATGSGSSVSMSNGTINASGGNAHGVDVTYGGSIILNNVNVTTNGASSSALATDFGGGTVTVTGGTTIAASTQANSHSAGIYSTGIITVNNATISSSGDCGGVIDGANSIILNNTNLAGSVEGIKIWKTAPAQGNAAVTITGGGLTSTNGDAFYVTNETGNAASAILNVSGGASIITGSGKIVDAIGACTVTFMASGETLTGDLITTGTSTIAATLKENTSLTGTINAASLIIDSTSTWTLTANSTLTTLSDAAKISTTDLSISNITGNGFNVHYDATLPGNSYLNGLTYSLVNCGVLTPGSNISGTAQYPVLGVPGAHGKISPSDTMVDCGSNVNIVITPDAGYQVATVQVNGVTRIPDSQFQLQNIKSKQTVTATFKAMSGDTIIATAGPGGTITPSGIVVVNSGQSQSFTITPDQEYRILDVKVDNSSVGKVYGYNFTNITSSHTIDATFEPIPVYTITATAGTGGSITPKGIVNVNEGDSKTFTITPNKGYDIADVKVDDSTVGKISAYPFINVTANHTIDASFEMIPLPVVECSINSTPLISGIPFGMTIELKNQVTGNPYYPPVNVPVTITTTGKGVLSGITSGTITTKDSAVTINNIIYTNDNGELNVAFSAGASGLTACTDTVIVMAKEPAIQDSEIVFSNYMGTSLSMAWTVGNGTKRLGIIKPNNPINASELPVDGMNYTANALYHFGQQIGNKGCYVIFNDSGKTVVINNLQLSDLRYYVMICGYNGDSLTANYNINTATNNPNTTNLAGVNDNKNLMSYAFEISNVAPNPVDNDFHFTLTVSRSMLINIEILDMNGRNVLTEYNNKTFDPGSTEINIPINSLSSGVYLIKVNSGNNIAFTKITIVR